MYCDKMVFVFVKSSVYCLDFAPLPKRTSGLVSHKRIQFYTGVSRAESTLMIIASILVPGDSLHCLSSHTTSWLMVSASLISSHMAAIVIYKG